MEALSETFKPDKRLVKKDLSEYQDFPEETIASILIETAFHYITPDVVHVIAGILKETSVGQFPEWYNPDELNKEGIYPVDWSWHSSPNQAFTEKDLIMDLTQMKIMFSEASQSQDYILNFTG